MYIVYLKYIVRLYCFVLFSKVKRLVLVMKKGSDLMVVLEGLFEEVSSGPMIL